MKLMPAAVIALAFVVLAPHAYAQSPMRPGNWETTMQFDMAGMPMQMPPMKSARCVTQEQIDSPNRGLPSGPAKNPNDCKVTDYNTAGNVITWKMACSGAQPMTGSGELRFKGDTYEGLIKMVMDQKEMGMKLSGKRLGDCTQ